MHSDECEALATKVAFLNAYGFKWVTYMTFTFTVSAADWGRIAPELILAGMALLLLLADLLLPGLRRRPGNGVHLRHVAIGVLVATA